MLLTWNYSRVKKCRKSVILNLKINWTLYSKYWLIWLFTLTFESLGFHLTATALNAISFILLACTPWLSFVSENINSKNIEYISNYDLLLNFDMDYQRQLLWIKLQSWPVKTVENTYMYDVPNYILGWFLWKDFTKYFLLSSCVKNNIIGWISILFAYNSVTTRNWGGYYL